MGTVPPPLCPWPRGLSLGSVATRRVMGLKEAQRGGRPESCSTCVSGAGWGTQTPRHGRCRFHELAGASVFSRSNSSISVSEPVPSPPPASASGGPARGRGSGGERLLGLRPGGLRVRSPRRAGQRKGGLTSACRVACWAPQTGTLLEDTLRSAFMETGAPTQGKGRTPAKRDTDWV